jgi:hypothetical protein
LEEHMGKGVNGKYRCGVKQAKEMVRITEGGERRFVCKVCVKGFKTKQNLSNHSSTHTSTHTSTHANDNMYDNTLQKCLLSSLPASLNTLSDSEK